MKVSINNPLLNIGRENKKQKKKLINHLSKNKQRKNKNILKIRIENKKKIDNKKIIDFEKNTINKTIINEDEIKRLKRNGDKRNKNKDIIYNQNIDENVNKKQKDNKNNKTKLPRSYFTLLISMFLLAIISVRLAYETYKENLEEDYAVFSSNDDYGSNIENTNDINTKLELQDDKTNNKDTIEEFIESKKEETVVIKKQETNRVKVEPLVFEKPIDGEIQKLYSPDKVIYSKTLEMWKTHDGIDISANISDVVRTIEKGTVERIYDDAFFGTTIIIDHSQGYKSIYSNLDSSVFVKEKQTITKGTKIGKIGKTAVGEYLDAPHLHFMLKYNNELVDPTYIFK